ncbi:glycosyltransferase [Gellertiella hungarica]|uniref:Mannosyltransferase n=1 Tax=Gellertiella hungarica TaxID=1572859 RepID=A0A7W6J3Z7_9HYPH|nr:mannosyltransferase [Gellertiella hungarica]
MVDIRDVLVIAPNFKRRLSGVTSTIVQLVPVQHRLGHRVATLGPGLPDGLPSISFASLWQLWRKPRGASARVWHARRNNEMLTGIILKYLLGMRLKLLFTSAAQRDHKPFTKWMIRRMDAVVATSAGSGAFLKVPYTVIRHGVDLAVFHPPETAEDTIEGAGLPGKYLIGCFGRIRHQKGTDLFVRAMVELLPRHPDWTAVICGRVTVEHTAFGEELKRRVREAGLSHRILFLGEVPDVKVWYRRLALYVAPSRNEGFGLTPLEAMASRTAVVASTAGAYAEMILPGTTGQVVPAGDYEALEAALVPYLADPAMTARTAEAALTHVRATFALENEALALKKIYDRLLTDE